MVPNKSMLSYQRSVKSVYLVAYYYCNSLAIKLIELTYDSITAKKSEFSLPGNPRSWEYSVTKEKETPSVWHRPSSVSSDYLETSYFWSWESMMIAILLCTYSNDSSDWCSYMWKDALLAIPLFAQLFQFMEDKNICFKWTNLHLYSMTRMTIFFSDNLPAEVSSLTILW